MTAASSPIHVFGVRHHGPGSARSLDQALRALAPDLVLVEGPVEGTPQISWVADAAMEPPVALLVYRPDVPLRSGFYPFARFSPEWIALKYALERGVPARFIDLPQTHWLALESEAAASESESEGEGDGEGEDPLRTLARVAGYSDFERWWERLVEDRGVGGGDSAAAAPAGGVFTAIHEAMQALRDDPERKPGSSREEALREASMRQQIRAAQKEGFARIAVVCGAWHAPALTTMPPASQDAALLKGLPKAKVEVTWIPWTHGRLARASGYGAGIESPGWYEHLWTAPAATSSVRWVSRVAQLLRAEDLDASPAHVIDTVRLAETLTAFRARRAVGLDEMNEAVETVLLSGDAAPLALIHRKLIVGERLGQVPPEASAVPIQRDFDATVKRLRWKLEANARTVDLDLRKDGDRERSQLLYRMALLGVVWGVLMDNRGKLGTFHEIWTLEWKPDFAIELIGAAQYGNTIEAAAGEFARQRAARAVALPELTALIDPLLKASLPAAAPYVLERLAALAAVAPDVGHLMDAVPPLAGVVRYGDVRQTDRETVRHVIEELLARICVSLPVACGALNDEAAALMVERLGAVHRAVLLLASEGETRAAWFEMLAKVADLPNAHGLVTGRAARLLLDAGALTLEEAARRASQCLSPGVDPLTGAAWIEGFLAGSGAVLLANQPLWELVDNWVRELTPEVFENTLPLLRRTFSTFAAPERRQMGERVAAGAGTGTSPGASSGVADIDQEAAARVLPLLERMLGIDS